mmetsp:Transcript_106264/g.205746  ORF Transcript_106264/g.205746 Transcript_106264/m.205746 type:complete len:729 (-) Transcript_106264:42-2228(-)
MEHRLSRFAHKVLCVAAWGSLVTLALVEKPELSRNSSLSDVTEIMKGIAYSPVPIKNMGETFPNDDFMSLQFNALWDDAGRGDLNIIKKLGANTVRLYGNDPRFEHQQFLQAANAHGLRVIAGMSNYPFRDAPNACKKTGWNCYEQIKEQYAYNLQNGFLQEDGSYNGALSHVIIINEPDYKAPGLNAPMLFCKAIISALDGILSAEKEANVHGDLIKFTATFSFGICEACSKYTTLPALGQMYNLRAAMLDPSTVGYRPKNDLRAAYESRFHHSFNVQSPAKFIQEKFLKFYAGEFQEQLFIGEYHAPTVPQSDDMAAILNLAEDPTNKFMGICYFEFQKSYWKGGTELDFGMLGLGKTALLDFTANGMKYTAWCLDNHVPDPHQQGTTLVKQVTQAYNGDGYDFDGACLFDPGKVPITDDGYKRILAQKSTARMMKFVKRVVGHLGGVAVDQSGLEAFAAGYSDEAVPPAGDFTSMVGVLAGTHPKWASWDTLSSACVVDHGALPQALEEAVDYACRTMQDLQTFNCADVPQECNETSTRADYVFSVYYIDVAKGVEPLQNCLFGGSAQYAPRETYKSWDSSCVITQDPGSTALTQQGYDAVLHTLDSDKVAGLITRVLSERLHEHVSDTSALKRLASNQSASLPQSFKQLMLVLRNASWTCGGETHRTCSPDLPQADAWIWLALATAIGVVIVVLLYFIWKQRQRQRRGRVPLVAESRRPTQELQ